MKVIKRPPNTSIYNTTYFNYDATYESLLQSKDVRALVETQKGHITCNLKQPEVFVEISPRGKVNIYYHKYDDRNEAVNILKELVVCHDFSLEQDVPRTLQSMKDGIETSRADSLSEPELRLRLEYARYLSSTMSPKTVEALEKGLRGYFRVAEDIENTTEWIVTFGITITEEILPRLDYVKTCDRLAKGLTSALGKSPLGFRLYEDHRDGEVLSLRYSFIWCPADGPLELPQVPHAEYWERLELAPFKEIYPDSDFGEIYEDDDGQDSLN